MLVVVVYFLSVKWFHINTITRIGMNFFNVKRWHLSVIQLVLCVTSSHWKQPMKSFQWFICRKRSKSTRL